MHLATSRCGSRPVAAATADYGVFVVGVAVRLSNPKRQRGISKGRSTRLADASGYRRHTDYKNALMPSPLAFCIRGMDDGLRRYAINTVRGCWYFSSSLSLPTPWRQLT